MTSSLRNVRIYFGGLITLLVIYLLTGIIAFRDDRLFSLHTIRIARAHVQYLLFSGKPDGGAILKRMASALFGRRGEAKHPQTIRENERSAMALPVLVYHSIYTEDDGSAINTTVAKFRDQLFLLKRAGYTAITTDELYAFLKGEQKLPEKSVMITFDDGRRDSYEQADPYLAALGWRAVMFIITRYSLDTESDYYLNAADLRQMEKSGRWDVQVHTHSGHETYVIDSSGQRGPFYANKFWLRDARRLETDEKFKERIMADMLLGKKKLEDTLNKPMRGFAFPFGDFGQNQTNFNKAPEIVLASAKKIFNLIFFQGAPGVRFNMNYLPADETARKEGSFLIRRIIVDSSWDGAALLSFLEKAAPKALPLNDFFLTDNGWITSWGEVQAGGGKMVLYPRHRDQKGAGAVLDGTAGWENYEVRATIEAPLQNSAFLWVRFRDDHHNAACNFGKGFAHVEQVVDGVKTVKQGVRSPDIEIPRGEFEIMARVYGRNIECYLNNDLVVASPFLEPSLKQGGIGFKTWDTRPGQTALIVKTLHVVLLNRDGSYATR